MQYKTSAEKEADNGEKFFKDFNNFINMKIKTLFKTIFCAGLVLTLVLYLCHLYGNYIEKNTGAYYWLYITSVPLKRDDY